MESSNYYSISDICATQTKFQFEVENTSYGLGFLDVDSTSMDLMNGKTIDLPMWLFMDLKRYLVSSVKAPETYSLIFKEICDADAYSLDLGKINKYYFEFGLYICQINDETTEGLLPDTFRQRARILVDLCRNTSNDLNLSAKFDNNELELYMKGCRKVDLISKWLLNHSQYLETAEMVSNHKKRKRVEMEFEKRKK